MKFNTLSNIVSLAALSLAQITVHSDGSYSCAIANAAYCASTTLNNNIIIRCTNGVGQAGNCNDNLAGEYPVGVKWAPCWQSSPTAGDAACSKNGTVYPESGVNYNDTTPFPIPGSIVSSGNASSIATSSLGIITSTSTRTRTHTRTTTVSTTVTTRISNNSTSSGVTPTTMTTSSSSSTSSEVAEPSASMTYTAFASSGHGVVHTSVVTTLNETICPESMTTTAASTLSLSSSTITTSPAAIFHPSAAVFPLPLNTTIINLGPGPVSVHSTISYTTSGTSLRAPYNNGPAVLSNGITGPVNETASGVHSTLQTTTTSYASLTSAGVNGYRNSSTVKSPMTAATGMMTYTGVAGNSNSINILSLVAYSILAVVLT
ncbi:hypothetical protein AAFC00_004819 [Neodothiora populina]|uniref:Uncharacterized protein n=1 Tax=Neodothiora populina TaxID=2781224 RepID=A0ABR3P4P1_9PEZI